MMLIPKDVAKIIIASNIVNIFGFMPLHRHNLYVIYK
jgi:hypothetical protein